MRCGQSSLPAAVTMMPRECNRDHSRGRDNWRTEENEPSEHTLYSMYVERREGAVHRYDLEVEGIPPHVQTDNINNSDDGCRGEPPSAWNDPARDQGDYARHGE